LVFKTSLFSVPLINGFLTKTKSILDITVPNLLDMDRDISLISAGEFENLSFSLAEWQKSQLENVTTTGIQCLLYMWFTIQPQLDTGYSLNYRLDSLTRI